MADWNGFLATIMWSYTGWDSLGCLAGEVKDPRTTFINGTLVTMLLVTITFALPLIVSIATHPDYWTWNSGAFTRFTSDVAPWLGIFCTVAALCAHASVFNASLSTSSRALWALAGGDGSSDMPVRHVPSIFAQEWRATGAPMVAVAAHALVVILLSLLPFDMLVKAQVLLASTRILMEVAAFLWLRRKHPPTSRHPDNYVLPFGWWGAAAISIPQVLVVALIVAIADPLVWTIGLSVNAVGVVVFGVRMLYDRRIYGRWWPRGHCNLGNDQTPRRRQWLASIRSSPFPPSSGSPYEYLYAPATATGTCTGSSGVLSSSSLSSLASPSDSSSSDNDDDRDGDGGGGTGSRSRGTGSRPSRAVDEEEALGADSSDELLPGPGTGTGQGVVRQRLGGTSSAGGDHADGRR